MYCTIGISYLDEDMGPHALVSGESQVHRRRARHHVDVGVLRSCGLGRDQREGRGEGTKNTSGDVRVGHLSRRREFSRRVVKLAETAMHAMKCDPRLDCRMPAFSVRSLFLHAAGCNMPPTLSHGGLTSQKNKNAPEDRLT